jgi:hypothetical protein
MNQESTDRIQGCLNAMTMVINVLICQLTAAQAAAAAAALGVEHEAAAQNDTEDDVPEAEARTRDLLVAQWGTLLKAVARNAR